MFHGSLLSMLFVVVVAPCGYLCCIEAHANRDSHNGLSVNSILLNTKGDDKRNNRSRPERSLRPTLIYTHWLKHLVWWASTWLGNHNWKTKTHTDSPTDGWPTAVRRHRCECNPPTPWPDVKCFDCVWVDGRFVKGRAISKEKWTAYLWQFVGAFFCSSFASLVCCMARCWAADWVFVTYYTAFAT